MRLFDEPMPWWMWIIRLVVTLCFLTSFLVWCMTPSHWLTRAFFVTLNFCCFTVSLVAICQALRAYLGRRAMAKAGGKYIKARLHERSTARVIFGCESCAGGTDLRPGDVCRACGRGRRQEDQP